MKKLLTALMAVVFLAATVSLAAAQSAPAGNKTLPVHKIAKRNKAADPNLPKPGQKVHPKGKHGTVRKLIKGAKTGTQRHTLPAAQ